MSLVSNMHSNSSMALEKASLTGRPPLSKEVDLNAYSKYQADLNTLDKIEKSL